MNPVGAEEMIIRSSHALPNPARKVSIVRFSPHRAVAYPESERKRKRSRKVRFPAQAGPQMHTVTSRTGCSAEDMGTCVGRPFLLSSFAQTEYCATCECRQTLFRESGLRLDSLPIGHDSWYRPNFAHRKIGFSVDRAFLDSSRPNLSASPSVFRL